MRKLFFPKLAAENLRKNAKIYFPFILTAAATVAFFYMICSLANNRGIDNRSVLTMLMLASRVAAVFSLIFLFYTNSFLMKRRKLELGLYQVLGMGKKHIALTLVWETAIIAAVSITLGLASGILLDKLLFLTVMKIIGGTVSFGFNLSLAAVAYVFWLFTAIFALILVNSLRQIWFSKPAALLKAGQTGEREPKAQWLLALMGAVCLGAGYAIAITTKNPVEVINLFFLAVLLVMVGTYLLFTTGSIVVLKLLRSRRNFYYQTKHFITVSGMIYRMKQNAAGLTNICLLSTAVLVMLSTTLSLYIGIEDVLRTFYPQTFILETSEDGYAEPMRTAAGEVLRERNLVPENEVMFRYFDFGVWAEENRFTAYTDLANINNMERLRNVVVIPLTDYNQMTDNPQTLSENEVLIFSNREKFPYDRLSVMDHPFTIKQKIGAFRCGDFMTSDLAISHYLIVRDPETFLLLFDTQKAAYGDNASPLRYRYAFDLDAPAEQIIEADPLIRNIWTSTENGSPVRVSCRDAERKEILVMYGGLFFVGLFLGVLFIMATVLIIYYKQITEGYNDKERFVIMKKVGLSRDEIKKTIRSQILSVFFLPLLTAGMHIAAAFPVLTQILNILNLTNVKLFMGCTLACFAFFALFYTLVYSLTARTYYRIVG